ncbi:MAG TPA: SDR family NAD(P)-dependent oxidoreductase [Flavisolibacter sp.]|nr:SDR family NAD(P)-dependent oxidoreductase [Flavisolibacter sp.]
MARVFITGSADGLGHMAARQLVAQGHKVMLHARSEARGRQALDLVPGAEGVLTADLGVREETIRLAGEVNASGPFDAVIHNAGVYQAAAPLIFEVNTIAPYILTCLIQKPQRLIYLSSGMHLQGDPDLRDLNEKTNRTSYSSSKLHVVILAMAAARLWPTVISNAVNPGWVPTKMGGPGAPDSLQKGAETQIWLATARKDKAKLSGRYFHHKQESRFLSAAAHPELQNRFLDLCGQITGITFPA